MPIAHDVNCVYQVIGVSWMEPEFLLGGEIMHGMAGGDPEGLTKTCDLETEAIPAPVLLIKRSSANRLFLCGL